MDTTRLIAITVFAAWILAALTATISFVFWLSNLNLDFNINEPYENRDESSITISDTALTVAGLKCEIVDSETVKASGTVTNTGSRNSFTLTTIVRLNASDGTELDYFRSPLLSFTAPGPLDVGEEEEFELSGRMAPGAETCEVEFWEFDERTRLSGETSADVR